MRSILLVLDGLGVGSLDANQPTNTLRSIVEATNVELPTLTALGIANLGDVGIAAVNAPIASHGRAALAYTGADSYLGHQEIFGTVPPTPRSDLIDALHEPLTIALREAGHHVTSVDGGPALLVDNHVLVADNLEAAPGQAINLTVASHEHPYSNALNIGNVVRDNVANTRVIVCGGTAFDTRRLLAAVERTTAQQHGVSTPNIDLYDQGYEVRHLGLPVDTTRQLQHAATTHHVPIAAFGKSADLAQGRLDIHNPIVGTVELLDALTDWHDTTPNGIAIATVQETDLAGHSQDVEWFAEILTRVDQWLHEISVNLNPDDVIAITSDHGNDPVLGRGQHSREWAPVLWYQPDHTPTRLNDRTTLADLAATICTQHGLHNTGDGTPLEIHQKAQP